MAPRRGQKRSASTAGSASKKRGQRGKKQKPEDETAAEEKKPDESALPESSATTESGSGSQQKAEVTADVEEDDSKRGGKEETKEQTENGKQDKSDVAVIEKGHLYFFYRPKVDAQEVKGPGDIQKLYILMSPEGAVGRPAQDEEIEGKRGGERTAYPDHAGKPMHRLLVISGKQLPGKQSRRLWAFVDAVSSDLHEVENNLERYSYDTKTRGERVIQPARLAGEAHYELVKHGDDTHLIYELELPSEPTEVQRAFNIAKEGQFLIIVKNPHFETPARSERWAGFKGDAKAQFPPHLQEHFTGKIQPEVRYTALSTVDFINVRHCEVVLLPVQKGAKTEWGKLVDEMEEEMEEEGEKNDKDAYKELEMAEKEHPDAVQEFK